MTNAITSNAATNSASSPSSKPSTASQLSSDFDTFLQMMTAQARYQDPLEPMDSSEYAAQLAQFSMVEQQVQGNDLLKAIQSGLGLGNITSLAGWVGKEARAAIPAYFDGDPVRVSARAAPGATGADLVVLNSSGKEVQRLTLPDSNEPFLWTGTKSDGAALPSGHYTLSIESHAKGEVIGVHSAQVYGRITEAQVHNGAGVVIFEGGTAVDPSVVTGLRNPA